MVIQHEKQLQITTSLEDLKSLLLLSTIVDLGLDEDVVPPLHRRVVAVAGVSPLNSAHIKAEAVTPWMFVMANTVSHQVTHDFLVGHDFMTNRQQGIAPPLLLTTRGVHGSDPNQTKPIKSGLDWFGQDDKQKRMFVPSIMRIFSLSEKRGSPTEERKLMQQGFKAQRVDTEPERTDDDTRRADGNSMACGLWLDGGEW
ncbi:hypothetical protein PIB30_062530 [Stylosanthes scabra]|uniref:Uncharacterized protein n=1 Tax=Stylosanthes scabra TaxID=79078 RepID=A0ABU6RL85_9FABA|nr:hypothetical protein [Stylosanthes scabra]